MDRYNYISGNWFFINLSFEGNMKESDNKIRWYKLRVYAIDSESGLEHTIKYWYVLNSIYNLRRMAKHLSGIYNLPEDGYMVDIEKDDRVFGSFLDNMEKQIAVMGIVAMLAFIIFKLMEM